MAELIEFLVQRLGHDDCPVQVQCDDDTTLNDLLSKITKELNLDLTMSWVLVFKGEEYDNERMNDSLSVVPDLQYGSQIEVRSHYKHIAQAKLREHAKHHGAIDIRTAGVHRDLDLMCLVVGSKLFGEQLWELAQTHVNNDDGVALTLLFEAGMDVNMQNKSHKTLLHFACHYDDDDGWEDHVDARPNAVHALLAAHANVHSTDKHGYTPLFYCCSEKETLASIKVVQALVNACAGEPEPCFWCDPDYLWSCLRYKAFKTAKILVTSGFKVNVQNNNGSTPLHLVCNRKESPASIELVKALLAANANVNVQDKKGRTPLHYSCCNVSPKVTALLLEAGANVTLRTNRDRLTPFEVLRVIPNYNQLRTTEELHTTEELRTIEELFAVEERRTIEGPL